MLSSGSGCSPMTSSPLISPRLWESRLTQLKVWRPSGRCTCAGHLWRWWVVYAPNFPGSTTWLCEPLLACLFPCHSCAFHTLSRDLQVWRRGHLVPHSVSTQLDVPGGERDAVSQGHTSGIPTRAMLHSWKLAPAAHHVLLSILVMTSPAPDVWPSILTDYTYDSELDNADGVPHSVSTQRLVPSGNQGYIRNLGRYQCLRQGDDK